MRGTRVGAGIVTAACIVGATVGIATTASAQEQPPPPPPTTAPPPDFEECNGDDCDIDLTDQLNNPEGADPDAPPEPAPATPTNEGDGGGGSDDEPEPPEEDECVTRAVPLGDRAYDDLAGEAGDPANDDEVLYAEQCGLPVGAGAGVTATIWENPFWAAPGEPDEDPEEAFLQEALANLTGNLLDPEVSTNPVGDRAAIVNVPVFISVDNWPSEGFLEESVGDGCGTPGGVCATATAVAELWYVPGEPGSEPFQCDQPPGAPYNRDEWTDDPFVQADWPETCAWAYETATDGDATWPAEVEIRWVITGELGSTGAEVDLGTDVTSQDIARNINEVRTIVTD